MICSYIPQGLPPSLFHLPHTREYLASRPNIVNTPSSSIWDTDGTGRNQGDWPVYGEANQTHPYLMPSVDDNSRLVERQLELFALQPREGIAYMPRYIPSSSALIHGHAQASQMPAVQQWRTDNLSSE
jgi:hypothetical protein